ncbi:uncharacterized protein LOC108711538 isoform X5 [Xenopus laevis]|uniref:Uncharacterized protein LOC108711538 isoform X5 n=2 Tax=Xenopus laevis TaxID=8355 RepID=A0A8J1L5S9_XENLA|nr:uncharacterized protein LOC108711538 isoform X5 [Xenopus laevis]
MTDWRMEFSSTVLSKISELTLKRTLTGTLPASLKMERGRSTAPRRRVLRPQRFRDEEDVGQVHGSGAKRKVNFSPLGGRSNRRRRMMEAITGDDAASSHGPEEEFGGSGSEEDGGGMKMQASRDSDDVIAPEGETERRRRVGSNGERRESRRERRKQDLQDGRKEGRGLHPVQKGSLHRTATGPRCLHGRLLWLVTPS